MLNTDKAVIRDDIGILRLRQCQPKISCQRATSQHVIATNRKTIGDILNKLKFNNHPRDVVRGF
jgi:hypothetical protein